MRWVVFALNRTQIITDEMWIVTQTMPLNTDRIWWWFVSYRALIHTPHTLSRCPVDLQNPGREIPTPARVCWNKLQKLLICYSTREQIIKIVTRGPIPKWWGEISFPEHKRALESGRDGSKGKDCLGYKTGHWTLSLKTRVKVGETRLHKLVLWPPQVSSDLLSGTELLLAGLWCTNMTKEQMV